MLCGGALQRQMFGYFCSKNSYAGGGSLDLNSIVLLSKSGTIYPGED